MTELHDLSATEIADLVRHRALSVPEVTEAALRRSEADTLGAFTTLAREHATRLAAALQKQFDEAPDAPLPRLFGVPTAIKDLEATRGIRTTYGSAVFADLVPDVDDEIVQILRAGGLVDLGKTTVPELGAACYTEPEVAAPSRSPFDPSRSAAGSSGGAAVAVGARLVPIAQGSDTAGSLRSPAGACGVVGFKPSRGLITAGPAGSDGVGLTVKGPIARTVRDTAALLDLMASRPGSGTVHPEVRPGGFEAAATRNNGRADAASLRVVLMTESISGAPTHPEVAAAAERTARMLEQLGHTVRTQPLRPDDELVESFTAAFSALAGTKPVPPGEEHRLRPIVRHLRERSRTSSAADLALALHRLQVRTRLWAASVAGADVVVTPTMTQPPVPLGSLRDDADPAAELRAMTAFTGNTILANASGYPAVSLPLGWSAEGVPLGVTLMSGWGRDALLLTVAAALEEALPWRHRYALAPDGADLALP